MKKLIVILVLLPFFSFSQTLVKNVSRMSYLDTAKDFHKTTEVLTNMSIFVKNGFLYIKDDIETLKYKITNTYVAESNGEEVTVYEILIKKEKYFASVSYFKGSTALLLESAEDTDITFFYEKRG